MYKYLICWLCSYHVTKLMVSCWTGGCKVVDYIVQKVASWYSDPMKQVVQGKGYKQTNRKQDAKEMRTFQNPFGLIILNTWFTGTVDNLIWRFLTNN